MTRRVLKRPSAERDIEESFVYIGEDNIDASLAFLEAVEEALGILANNPFIGSTREFEDLKAKGLRMWLVRGFDNYEIFYIVEEDRVEIVRVLHSARDIPRIFRKK
jgi:toxin ParE1/3/4